MPNEVQFQTELQLHSKMQHPNIVGFYRAFQFEKSIFVVLEMCSNGSIMDMVRKRRCLTLPEVRRYTVQLCGAVKYMHKRHVAHRDLKMGNIFLDHEMNVKVGDFGLAACIISDKDERRRRTLCGTPNYIAPEVLDKSKGGHNQKVDIWSIGVIIFAMLTGICPFHSATQNEIYEKVRNLDYGWPDRTSLISNHIPEEAKDLVRLCLSLEENDRPEPDELVDHPFFDMYSGCIPRTLESSLLRSSPVWVKTKEPQGDCMITGYSLDYDRKYKSKITHTRDPEERYAICRDEFYKECGVGRTVTGSLRKSAGKRCSKSAYHECVMEDSLGLQPAIPLPLDRVYTSRYTDGDWSLEYEEQGPSPTITAEPAYEPRLTRTASQRMQVEAVAQARTEAALAAAQLRRHDHQPLSHASVLRQQAIPRSSLDDKETTPDRQSLRSTQTARRPLEDPPQRPGTRITSLKYSSPNEPDLQLPKTSSVPANLTVAKTRSQSRRQLAALHQSNEINEVKKTEIAEAANSEPKPTTARAKSFKLESPKEKLEPEAGIEVEEQPAPQLEEKEAPVNKPKNHAPKLSSSKSAAANKSRGALGVNPLIHPSEKTETLLGTTMHDVQKDLRIYLRNLRTDSEYSRSRPRQPCSQLEKPHAYVVKWVDYTNRYGIGYVLDDGSVGCVFKAEHGRPASGVVIRDGELHIRKKSRAKDNQDPSTIYPDHDQLVARGGPPVEFYEQDGVGVQRALVKPECFEVKNNGASGNATIRMRFNGNAEMARCEAEKVKRVKLVDQFGKYMIGSLGRASDEEEEDSEKHASRHTNAAGQFVKFYQRLGNVGVWGFGDGAFQFNFPDHTKVVLALVQQKTRAARICQIDFYHLAPGAARYLASRGKMHPSGFDTRAVFSGDVSTFFDALCSDSNSRLGDILRANAFSEKLDFIRTVFTGWLQTAQLGCRITLPISSPGALHPAQTARHPQSTGPVYPGEIFWAGAQERSWTGATGGKFVWVTVGAHGGDGEYIAVSLKRNAATGDVECLGADGEMEELGMRLRGLALGLAG